MVRLFRNKALVSTVNIAKANRFWRSVGVRLQKGLTEAVYCLSRYFGKALTHGSVRGIKGINEYYPIFNLLDYAQKADLRIYLQPMETIPKSDCQKIGFIRKTHGVHGELVLEYEPEFEESVAEASRFFLEIDGLLVPFFVAEDGLRFRSAKTALVTFDWVDTEKYAHRLVESPVYLFNCEIIDEPGNGTTSQFLHFRLLDETGKEVGKISAVDDYAGNIVFTVDAEAGEILVPFNEDFLINMNEEQKSIQLRLPEGLIDEL